MLERLDGLKLREIALFLDLLRAKSMRELSRQIHLPPGQISKVVKSLEKRLNRTLIHRSANGISLTAYGTEVVPYLEAIRHNQLKLAGHGGTKDSERAISIGTTSFFSSQFLPEILSRLHELDDQLQCQIIDLPPSQFIPVALRSGFSVCIHLGDLDWPKTWTSVRVGQVQWHLYCRKGHPVLKNPNLTSVLKNKFVYPIYWTPDGIRRGNDYFPVPILKRKMGIQTATAIGAAQIVAKSDQLGFLPDLAAHSIGESSGLHKVKLRGLKPVHEPVYLSVKSDLVKQKSFEWLIARCKENLLAVGG
jgi:DNA-binding transcriptional LysR family regulator